jgi:cell division septum initiation protein DivIVA
VTVLVDELLGELEARLSRLQASQKTLLRRIRDLRHQVLELSERVDALEHRRSTKATPVLVKEVGVCGLNPEINSGACPNATVYRHQQGCMGTACTEVNRKYYAEYRAKKRSGQA